MEEIRERRNLTGYKKIFEDLYKDFYSLYYDLRENKESFGGDPQIYKLKLQTLFNFFKKEYYLFSLDYELYYKKEVFEKKEKIANLTPRAWRFFGVHQNVPAQLIVEDVNIKSETFFKECEAANDAARPEYMEKLWLTRADKKEAKRAEKAARKAEKAARKAASQAVKDLMGRLDEETSETPRESPQSAFQSAAPSEIQENPQSAPQSAAPAENWEESNVGEETPKVEQISEEEEKKQARLRALEERRKQKREQERAATSAESPKTGT